MIAIESHCTLTHVETVGCHVCIDTCRTVLAWCRPTVVCGRRWRWRSWRNWIINSAVEFSIPCPRGPPARTWWTSAEVFAKGRSFLHPVRIRSDSNHGTIRHVARLSTCSSVETRCTSALIDVLRTIMTFPTNFTGAVVNIGLNRSKASPTRRTVLTGITKAFVDINFAICTVEASSAIARVRINTIDASATKVTWR